MRIFIRVVLFILAFILLLGLACVLSTFTAIPWLTDFVAGLVKGYGWLPTVFAAFVLFCMAATVLALVLLVSLPTRRHLYVLRRSAGQIEITTRSIESAAGQILAGVPGVKRSHVRIKGNPRPHKIRLYAEVEPRDPTQPFAALGEAIQLAVKEGLENSLAISPQSIRVRIRQGEYQKDTDGRRGSAKVPRVI